LVNKPYKWTSFDVVGKLRNAFKPLKLKVGHAGTLDPLATGLLIICTGKMTKQIDSFMGMPKTYSGVISIGATTPSVDLETPFDATFPIAHITETVLEHARIGFVGDIMQIPPIFSAIKQDGKKLYESARKNEVVDIPARPVRIIEFKIMPNLPDMDMASVSQTFGMDRDGKQVPVLNVPFSVRCSKGTYIRSLARDFGEACQSGAYLSALCREGIGEYKLADAWKLDDLIASIIADD